MKQYYMVIDVERCQDCNNCFMGCKDEHVGNDWPGYTAAQPRHGHKWISIEARERGQYPRIGLTFRPTPCQHCENAPCIEKGNGAVYRREDGIVMIDPEKAKGKKELLDSCPFNAIYWNDEENVPQKCTMCAHLLDDPTWLPAKPRCAHNCASFVWDFYKLEPEEMAKIVEEQGLEVLKPELNLKPHVFYKNLHQFDKNFISAGVLVKGDCFEGATVTLKKGGAAVATQTTNFFGDFKFDALENGEYVVEVEADGKTASETIIVDDKSQNIGYIEL